VNDAEKGGHHIWTSNHEQQGLNNYNTKDLLLSALAHLSNDNHAQPPYVEKSLYATIHEAWKEYETTDNPSSPV
jgi:hypothetical protein